MSKKTAVGRGKTPFFMPNDEQAVYPALDKNTNCEILIIGGGLTGLFVAYHLMKAGREVCLVEKAVVAGGETRYLPPVVEYDADVTLSALKKQYGQEDALYFYRQFVQSLKELKALVGEIPSDCGFLERDSFYYTDKESNTDRMQEEYRFRKYGGFDVEWIDKNTSLNMFSFPVECGIYSRNLAAEINPVRFAKDFANYLSVNGVQLYEQTELELITEKDEGGYYADTLDGYRIDTGAVCDCRGYELLKRYKELGKLYTSFTSVSAPVSAFPGWYNRCILKYDSAKPLYVSSTADERIVISGFDSRLARPDGAFIGLNTMFYQNYKYENLHLQAEDMFFGIDKLFFQFDCCGLFIKTRDGLPFVGEDMARKNFYYACCGNKNSVLYANLAGKIISGEYSKNPYWGANLFSLYVPN